MTRERKFRAYSKYEKEMVWFDLSNVDEALRGDSVVMDYTGLKDKNGKEIYEDDVCRADTQMSLGCFENSTFIVEYDFEEGYGWNNWDIKTIEIIGNIHDNPEMLDKYGVWQA